MISGTEAPPMSIASHEVTIEGVPSEVGVDVVVVETSRTLGGNLPGNDRGGAPGASGSVSVFTPGYGTEPSPWARRGNWPPRPGSGVSCSAGTVEAGLYPVLDGTVRQVSPAGGGVLSVEVSDPMDPLTRVLSVPALASSMPPATVGGELLRPGLSADYVANRVLRACGVWNTPLMPANMVGVSVPLQGAAHPERGTCTRVHAVDQPTALVNFNDAPWGFAVFSMDATYLPSDTNLAAVQVGVMAAPNHAATAVVTLDRPGGILNLTVNSLRQVTIAGPSGSVVLPADPGWVRVRADVTNGGQATLTDDTGRTATGVVGGASSLTAVRVRAEVGSRIAGLMVGSNIGSGYLTGTPNLVMAASPTLTTGMLACPAIIATRAVDILHDIATATLRTWAWTVEGVLRWTPADRLFNAAAVTDLTTTDHVGDYAWEDSLDRHHRAVTVRHKRVLDRLLSKFPDLDVWRGSGVTFETPDGEAVEFATVPDDEVWLGVDDTAVPYIGSDAPENIQNYNLGRDSSRGGVLVSGDVQQWTFPGSSVGHHLITSIRRVTDTTWVINHASSTDLPAGSVVAARTAGPDSASALYSWRRDEALPVLRAHYRASLIDVETTSATTAPGNTAAADYVHDAGIWVQGYNGELPAAYADWLAGYVLDPPALITGLSVDHDPRRQVGDVVNIIDTHRYQVIVTGIITGLSQSSRVENGTAEQSMTLDLVVTSAPQTQTTWGDMQVARPGTWGQAQTDSTYGTAQATQIGAT